MILSDDQLDRYARQIVLKEIGGAGQKALLASKVAVVGAGGVGSPVLLYLAAAGVGEIQIIDSDQVSLDNLHRQILFSTPEVGRLKAQVAGERLRALNPGVTVVEKPERLDRGNAERLINDVNCVVDGSDNFATRLLVSDTCTAAHIPLTSAALGQFQVQVGSFRGWEVDQPCYRCFVGDAFDSDDCDSCAELGLLGAMAGIAGSMAALECLRLLTGFGEDPAGKLHLFDGLKPAWRSLRIAKDPNCSACQAPTRLSA